MARAWVALLTEVDAACATKGDASACALLDASISASAQAHARASAKAWAGTLSKCGCAVELDAAADALATVLVKATLEVKGDVCVGAPPRGCLRLDRSRFVRLPYMAQGALRVQLPRGQLGSDRSGTAPRMSARVAYACAPTSMQARASR